MVSGWKKIRFEQPMCWYEQGTATKKAQPLERNCAFQHFAGVWWDAQNAGSRSALKEFEDDEEDKAHNTGSHRHRLDQLIDTILHEGVEGIR